MRGAKIATDLELALKEHRKRKKTTPSPSITVKMNFIRIYMRVELERIAVSWLLLHYHFSSKTFRMVSAISILSTGLVTNARIPIAVARF